MQRPTLVPLAKQGRTVVKGKCSICGHLFTILGDGIQGTVADQFAKHIQQNHPDLEE